MVVMYPLAAQLDYTELKYSLRSVDKYLKDVDEIIIVGNIVPEWLNNVTVIEYGDIPGRKQISIRSKVLVALEYTKEFLFFNDDCFLLQPAESFPYYWHGYLKNYSESGSKPLLKQLEQIGKPVKHFDGHYNLIYERAKFIEAMQHFSEDTIIKSAYCNYWNIEGIFSTDCKLLKAAKPEQIRNFIKDLPCFSTGIWSLPSALSILHELFPEPSKYEI